MLIDDELSPATAFYPQLFYESLVRVVANPANPATVDWETVQAGRVDCSRT